MSDEQLRQSLTELRSELERLKAEKAEDPRISPSSEHSAATTTDLGATLIPSPLVSQCH